MNLPNKLTTLRVILIPVFIVLFIFNYRLISGVVFIVASFTDFLDGYLARKYNLVTNYGKLMDPLADKMLVISALVLLSSTNEINYIFTLIVIIRELAISSIRLIALEQGIVVAASIWGKVKTSTQMVSIILFLFEIHKINSTLNIIVYVLFYFSMLFVIISFIDYVIKNRDVFIKGGI